MDEASAREILGIGPHATRAQARAAYKRRAKTVHPDRHARAGEPARAEAERAMSELNEAWRTVKNAPLGGAGPSDGRPGDRRPTEGPPSEGPPSGGPHGTSPRATRGGGPHSPAGRRYTSTPPAEPSHERPRPPRGCERCGYLPAIRIDVRSLRGVVVIHLTDRFAGVLCRDCGLALCRDVQAETLTYGWWGLPAVFVNAAVLVNNWSYFRALRALPAPTQRAAGSPAPQQTPDPPGRAVLARAGPWLAIVLLLSLLTLAFLVTL